MLALGCFTAMLVSPDCRPIPEAMRRVSAAIWARARFIERRGCAANFTCSRRPTDCNVPVGAAGDTRPAPPPLASASAQRPPRSPCRSPMDTEPRRAGPEQPPPRARRILVVDADRDCVALLEQWLSEAGFEVLRDADAGAPVDSAIVDVPQPRSAGTQAVRLVADRHPGTPILAVSSAFFPGIEHCTAAPRLLGVDAVLAKPMSREALLNQLRRLLE
jgi:CheY-like chemotaxis protein